MLEWQAKIGNLAKTAMQSPTDFVRLCGAVRRMVKEIEDEVKRERWARGGD